MNELTLAELQRATSERGKQWGSPGLQFRGLELGGETGEMTEAILQITVRLYELGLEASKSVGKALEAMKKIVRFQNNMAGGTEDTAALEDEMGDVIICVALLANELGLDLGAVVERKFNKTIEKYGFDVKLPLPRVRGGDPIAELDARQKQAQEDFLAREDHIDHLLRPLGPAAPIDLDRYQEWAEQDDRVRGISRTAD